VRPKRTSPTTGDCAATTPRAGLTVPPDGGDADAELVPYTPPAPRSRPKRGNNEGSVYRIKSGRQKGEWRGSVTLPGGGRKTISLGPKATREDVAAAVARVLADAQRGKVAASDGRLTVAAYLEQWLEVAVAPRVRRRTLVFYESHVRNYLIPAIGSVRLARLTVHDVQRLLNGLGGRISPRTVAHVRGTLRGALRMAIKWGLLTENVAQLTDAPRQVQHEISPLSVDESQRLLTVAGDALGGRLKPLLTVALATALRQGELLALRWADVDLERRTLTVRHTLEHIPLSAKGREAAYEFAEPKSRAGRRTLPLIAAAAEALAAQRVRCLELRLAAGTRWREHDLVFPSSIGTPLGARNLYRDYQKLLAEAGLPRKRFHDLRHSTATYLLAAGVDMKTISGLLGHSQISLTANTYTHLTPGLLGDAAAKLNALFSTAPAPVRDGAGGGGGG
jgi:integrase